MLVHEPGSGGLGKYYREVGRMSHGFILCDQEWNGFLCKDGVRKVHERATK